MDSPRTSVKLEGNVIVEPRFTINQHGFVWGPHWDFLNYVSYGTVKTISLDPYVGTGYFTAQTENIFPSYNPTGSNAYFVRAFVVIDDGQTIYGPTKKFNITNITN